MQCRHGQAERSKTADGLVTACVKHVPCWQPDRPMQSAGWAGMQIAAAVKACLEGLLDAFLTAVLHELKLAVWGHKADHLLRVELAQVHALVEGHNLRSVQAAAHTSASACGLKAA